MTSQEPVPLNSPVFEAKDFIKNRSELMPGIGKFSQSGELEAYGLDNEYLNTALKKTAETMSNVMPGSMLQPGHDQRMAQAYESVVLDKFFRRRSAMARHLGQEYIVDVNNGYEEYIKPINGGPARRLNDRAELEKIGPSTGEEIAALARKAPAAAIDMAFVQLPVALKSWYAKFQGIRPVQEISQERLDALQWLSQIDPSSAEGEYITKRAADFRLNFDAFAEKSGIVNLRGARGVEAALQDAIEMGLSETTVKNWVLEPNRDSLKKELAYASQEHEFYMSNPKYSNVFNKDMSSFNGMGFMRTATAAINQVLSDPLMKQDFGKGVDEKVQSMKETDEKIDELADEGETAIPGYQMLAGASEVAGSLIGFMGGNSGAVIHGVNAMGKAAGAVTTMQQVAANMAAFGVDGLLNSGGNEPLKATMEQAALAPMLMAFGALGEKATVGMLRNTIKWAPKWVSKEAAKVLGKGAAEGTAFTYGPEVLFASAKAAGFYSDKTFQEVAPEIATTYEYLAYHMLRKIVDLETGQRMDEEYEKREVAKRMQKTGAHLIGNVFGMRIVGGTASLRRAQNHLYIEALGKSNEAAFRAHETADQIGPKTKAQEKSIEKDKIEADYFKEEAEKLAYEAEDQNFKKESQKAFDQANMALAAHEYKLHPNSVDVGESNGRRYKSVQFKRYSERPITLAHQVEGKQGKTFLFFDLPKDQVEYADGKNVQVKEKGDGTVQVRVTGSEMTRALQTLTDRSRSAELRALGYLGFEGVNETGQKGVLAVHSGDLNGLAYFGSNGNVYYQENGTGPRKELKLSEFFMRLQPQPETGGEAIMDPMVHEAQQAVGNISETIRDGITSKELKDQWDAFVQILGPEAQVSEKLNIPVGELQKLLETPAFQEAMTMLGIEAAMNPRAASEIARSLVEAVSNSNAIMAEKRLRDMQIREMRAQERKEVEAEKEAEHFQAKTENLDEYDQGALKKMADQLGVKGTAKMSKPDLIVEIANAREAGKEAPKAEEKPEPKPEEKPKEPVVEGDLAEKPRGEEKKEAPKEVEKAPKEPAEPKKIKATVEQFKEAALAGEDMVEFMREREVDIEALKRDQERVKVKEKDAEGNEIEREAYKNPEWDEIHYRMSHPENQVAIFAEDATNAAISAVNAGKPVKAIMSRLHRGIESAKARGLDTGPLYEAMNAIRDARPVKKGDADKIRANLKKLGKKLTDLVGRKDRTKALRDEIEATAKKMRILEANLENIEVLSKEKEADWDIETAHLTERKGPKKEQTPPLREKTDSGSIESVESIMARNEVARRADLDGLSAAALKKAAKRVGIDPPDLRHKGARENLTNEILEAERLKENPDGEVYGGLPIPGAKQMSDATRKLIGFVSEGVASAGPKLADSGKRTIAAVEAKQPKLELGIDPARDLADWNERYPSGGPDPTKMDKVSKAWGISKKVLGDFITGKERGGGQLLQNIQDFGFRYNFFGKIKTNEHLRDDIIGGHSRFAKRGDRANKDILTFLDDIRGPMLESFVQQYGKKEGRKRAIKESQNVLSLLAFKDYYRNPISNEKARLDAEMQAKALDMKVEDFLDANPEKIQLPADIKSMKDLKANIDRLESEMSAEGKELMRQLQVKMAHLGSEMVKVGMKDKGGLLKHYYPRLYVENEIDLRFFEDTMVFSLLPESPRAKSRVGPDTKTAGPVPDLTYDALKNALSRLAVTIEATRYLNESGEKMHALALKEVPEYFELTDALEAAEKRLRELKASDTSTNQEVSDAIEAVKQLDSQMPEMVGKMVEAGWVAHSMKRGQRERVFLSKEERDPRGEDGPKRLRGIITQERVYATTNSPKDHTYMVDIGFLQGSRAMRDSISSPANSKFLRAFSRWIGTYVKAPLLRGPGSVVSLGRVMRDSLAENQQLGHMDPGMWWKTAKRAAFDHKLRQAFLAEAKGKDPSKFMKKRTAEEREVIEALAKAGISEATFHSTEFTKRMDLDLKKGLYGGETSQVVQGVWKGIKAITRATLGGDIPGWTDAIEGHGENLLRIAYAFEKTMQIKDKRGYDTDKAANIAATEAGRIFTDYKHYLPIERNVLDGGVFFFYKWWKQQVVNQIGSATHLPTAMKLAAVYFSYHWLVDQWNSSFLTDEEEKVRARGLGGLLLPGVRTRENSLVYAEVQNPTEEVLGPLVSGGRALPSPWFLLLIDRDFSKFMRSVSRLPRPIVGAMDVAKWAMNDDESAVNVLTPYIPIAKIARDDGKWRKTLKQEAFLKDVKTQYGEEGVKKVKKAVEASKDINAARSLVKKMASKVAPVVLSAVERGDKRAIEEAIMRSARKASSAFDKLGIKAQEDRVRSMAKEIANSIRAIKNSKTF